MAGGVYIPSQLIELGLADEYLFVVRPIIAGEGRRSLQGVSLPERLQLKLAESKILKSGCVALRYGNRDRKKWEAAPLNASRGAVLLLIAETYRDDVMKHQIDPEQM